MFFYTKLLFFDALYRLAVEFLQKFFLQEFKFRFSFQYTDHFTLRENGLYAHSIPLHRKTTPESHFYNDTKVGYFPNDPILLPLRNEITKTYSCQCYKIEIYGLEKLCVFTKTMIIYTYFKNIHFWLI